MMDHDERTGKKPDGSYRYVRPESREVLYRDANVESAEDAAQLPRCYIHPQKEEREKKEKKTGEIPGRGFFVKAVCMCLACAVLGGIAGGGITAVILTQRSESAREEQPFLDHTDNSNKDLIVPAQLTDNDTLSSNTVDYNVMTPSEIYEMACKQVVGVTTEVTRQNFWGMTSSSAVIGSGFIISEDGYILTNYHVIETADLHGYQVNVMLHDGTAHPANIVGIRPDNDIAVLQIEAAGLSAAEFGNSDAIKVGDAIHAVGNPMGELEFSMTNGSVSALDRVITTSEAIAPINMFQIDAAVNSGNSGGPVYNDEGEVVGVVTAKYSESGVEGLGFAIPINDAAEIANDLIARGDEGKTYLGVVNPRTMSAAAALYYNSVPGAYITDVVPDSAADRAGLQAGDVICQLGGIQISSAENLRGALRSYHPGDTVDVVFCRKGEEITVSVVLDEQPDSVQTDDSQDTVSENGEEDLYVYSYRNAVNW